MFLSINGSGCFHFSSLKKLLSPRAGFSTGAVIDPVQCAHTSSSHRLREGPSILADCSAFATDEQCSFRNSKVRTMHMNIDRSRLRCSNMSKDGAARECHCEIQQGAPKGDAFTARKNPGLQLFANLERRDLPCQLTYMLVHESNVTIQERGRWLALY